MIIPHRQLETQTLEAILDEIITRDGTMVGAYDRPLAELRQKLLDQLNREEVEIHFDEDSETCSLEVK